LRSCSQQDSRTSILGVPWHNRWALEWWWSCNLLVNYIFNWSFVSDIPWWWGEANGKTTGCCVDGPPWCEFGVWRSFRLYSIEDYWGVLSSRVYRVKPIFASWKPHNGSCKRILRQMREIRAARRVGRVGNATVSAESELSLGILAPELFRSREKRDTTIYTIVYNYVSVWLFFYFFSLLSVSHHLQSFWMGGLPILKCFIRAQSLSLPSLLFAYYHQLPLLPLSSFQTLKEVFIGGLFRPARLAYPQQRACSAQSWWSDLRRWTSRSEWSRTFSLGRASFLIVRGSEFSSLAIVLIDQDEKRMGIPSLNATSSDPTTVNRFLSCPEPWMNCWNQRDVCMWDSYYFWRLFLQKKRWTLNVELQNNHNDFQLNSEESYRLVDSLSSETTPIDTNLTHPHTQRRTVSDFFLFAI